MSRGEEKATVNVGVLQEALRERIGRRLAGKKGTAPQENTTPWYEEAARIADVSTGTLKKLLRGEAVTASILTTLLDRMQLSAAELVMLDERYRIPQDADAYRQLGHGLFIADLRTNPGRPSRRWCRERVDLRAVLEPASPESPQKLEGTITNEFDNTFDLRGSWIGPYPLTLTAQLRRLTPAGNDHLAVMSAFTSVFNLWYPLSQLGATPTPGDPGRVLCGFWHGVTCFGTPALYRFFLSTRRLEAGELVQLTKNLKAMTFLDAGELDEA